MELGNAGQPLICARGVVKEYWTPAGAFRALKGIDLEVCAGEFVSVQGKSGAGKTTLVNLLTGLDHISRGEIWVGNTPVHRLNENQLAAWRGRSLGIIYQSFHLMPTLSLLDNVMLPIDLAGDYHPRRSRQRALELLVQVGLEAHAHKLPAQISGGQQQRVAIARALANDPAVIMADEPTGRLDSANAENVFQIFLELAARGKTIVMVTHDESLAHRTPRRLVLEDGVFIGGRKD